MIAQKQSNLSGTLLVGIIMLVFGACFAALINPPVPQPLVIAPNTNTISKTVTASWLWPEDMSRAEGFILHHGTNQGVYYEQWPCGLVSNLTVTFQKRLGVRDYFMVEAVDVNGIGSDTRSEFVSPPINVQPVVIGLKIDCGEPSMILMKSRRPTTNLSELIFVADVHNRSWVVPVEAGPWFFCTTSAPGTTRPRLTITKVYQ